MLFIGIDLHTNRFTCCYRDERRSDRPQDRVMKTFDLNEAGLAADTYVPAEATITAFSFVRLFKDRVKEVIIGNTYQLKQISLARNNTDKIDADKLCQALKAQVLSGVRQTVPVTLPPVGIQELRSLFSTYRLYRKQNTQLKNRIHSLPKEQLYGFTQEEIFGKKSRQKIRGISENPVLSFQINQLTDRLERDEGDAEALKEQVLPAAQPYMAEIDILTSMKGVSVFIAIAVIADIIEVSRFKNSKHFTSCLRSAPRAANSNTTVKNRGISENPVLSFQINQLTGRLDVKLRKWYERLCGYKKAGLVRTGLRRRVLAEIYQMLKKGAYHYGQDPVNHEGKMAEYRRFLERQKKSADLKSPA